MLLFWFDVTVNNVCHIGTKTTAPDINQYHYWLGGRGGYNILNIIFKIYEWPHFSIFSLWMTKFFGHSCLRALFCWHTQLRKSKYLYLCIGQNFVQPNIWMGHFFRRHEIWMGPIFRLPGIWMGYVLKYVLKYRAARPYQNYLRVTLPPPPHTHTPRDYWVVPKGGLLCYICSPFHKMSCSRDKTQC